MDDRLELTGPRIATPENDARMIPVFIGGVDRSGTTLLGREIGETLGGIVLPESQFLRQFIPPVEASGIFREDIASKLSHAWRFAAWELPLDTVLARIPSEEPVGFGGLVEALGRAFGDVAPGGDPLVIIDHTPDNLRYATWLADCLPDARFVHIVRDGRAVYESVRPLDWGPRNALVAAEWWMAKLAEGLSAEVALPADRIVRVRFEDLCSDPSGTVRSVIDALGLMTCDGAGAEGYRLPRYTAKQHALLRRDVVASRADAWQASISPRARRVFERVAGGALVNLGYDVPPHHAADPVSAAARGLARLLDLAFMVLVKLPRRFWRIRRARSLGERRAGESRAANES